MSINTGIEINGKNLYPFDQALATVRCARADLLKWAKQNKIVAVHTADEWYVDIDSLKDYIDLIEHEDAVREKLSQNKIPVAKKILENNSQSTAHTRVANISHAKALVSMVLVVGIGLIAGSISNVFMSTRSGEQQTAATQNARVTGAEVPKTVMKPTLPDQVELQPYFTSEIRVLSQGGSGVLVFPEAGGATAVPEIVDLFSDTTEVRQLSDGRKVVWRLDSEGQPTGEPMPIVIVPVDMIAQ
jgi:hypothetical protein